MWAGIAAHGVEKPFTFDTGEGGVDVQAGYRFDWQQGLTVTAGVNNVFEKEPPICLSCSLNGYDASTYDLPGRFWYARVGFDF